MAAVNNDLEEKKVFPDKEDVIGRAMDHGTDEISLDTVSSSSKQDESSISLNDSQSISLNGADEAQESETKKRRRRKKKKERPPMPQMLTLKQQREAFDKADVDGNGLISKEEFVSVGLGTAEEFDKYDDDGSGEIGFEEFQKHRAAAKMQAVLRGRQQRLDAKEAKKKKKERKEKRKKEREEHRKHLRSAGSAMVVAPDFIPRPKSKEGDEKPKPPTQLEQQREAFRAVDVDGDGLVSKEEFEILKKIVLKFYS